MNNVVEIENAGDLKKLELRYTEMLDSAQHRLVKEMATSMRDLVVDIEMRSLLAQKLANELSPSMRTAMLEIVDEFSTRVMRIAS